MEDVGNLELLLGVIVAAAVLVAIVWLPLYAIVLRAERRGRAQDAAEDARRVDVTSDESRARFGQQFEADMQELTRFVDGPMRRAVSPGYASSPRFLGLPFMMDPTGPASLTSFGFHAMDRESLGGEIAC